MQVTAGMRKRMLVLIGVAAISGGAGLIAVAHAGSLQQGSGTGFIANLVPGSAGDNTADGVLGQVNFTEAEQNFRDSRGVNISPVGGGNVAIDRSVSPNRVIASDTNNNRVLGWTNISAFLSHAPANIVFGQPDFFSGKCNQNLGKPTPSTLCAPRGVAVDSTGRVYIADSGNNRVLEYDSPFTTNRVADDVFGQFGSFNTDDCNQGFSISQNSLCDPHGVGVDSAGNLYIADKENNRVVEFNTPEAITVTPGSGDFTADKVFGQLNNFTTGTCNNSGLNQNSLCKPYGVSADVSGNVYIADHDNNRVLEYNTPLTTNTTADRVFGQFNSFTAANCNDDGTISALTLCKPSSAAPDSAKNLYIADSGNNRVLEYNTPLVSGTTADHVFGQATFSTGICGLGSTALCNPSGVCIDSADTLYVADSGNNRQLSFTTPLANQTADGVLNQSLFTTNAQNKVDNYGIDTQFNNGGIAIDKSVVPNRVYVADIGNNRVLAWNNVSAFTTHAAANLVFGQPNVFTSIANNGGVKATTLNQPIAVAVDKNGNLFVADMGNNRVLEYNTPFTSGTTADKVFGQLGSFTTNTCISPINADTLCTPLGVAVDSNLNVYISDSAEHRVLEYNTPLTTNTTADKVFGQANFTGDQCNKGLANPSTTSLCTPWGVAVDPSNSLFVADNGNNRVLKYNTPGDTTADKVFGQLGSFGTATPNKGGLSANSLNAPQGVAADTSGNVYVVDKSNNRALKYNTPGDTTADQVFGQGGVFTTGSCLFITTPNTLCVPDGVATDSSKNVYVVDGEFFRILQYLAP